MALIYKRTKGRIKFYRRIGYEFNVDLDNPRNFITIFAGALFGGLTNGMIGTAQSMMIGLLAAGI